VKSFFRRIYSKIKADPSWSFFLAFAFLSAVSLPLARAAMVLSLVFTLASPARRRSIRITSPTLGWLVYLALAAAVTAAMWALDPEPGMLEPARGFRKLDKLLWYAAIPLAVAQVDSRTRLVATLRALVWGGAFAAAGVILLNPALAWIQFSLPTDWDITAGKVQPAAELLHRAANAVGKLDDLRRWVSTNGQPQSFQAALIKVGTMQAAQRLMVAVLAALCLLLEAFREPSRGRRFGAALLLLICTAGLVLTYKRGPLMACAAVSFAILLSRLSVWRAILVATLLAAVFGGVAAAVPPVRERFAQLPEEFAVRKGGRTAMWKVIVPELHREHPWGVGFRALTWKKIHYGMPELDAARDRRIRQVNRRIELNQNHMHSVPMQAFVDFGYAGLLAWLFWMMLGFRATGRLARLSRRPAPGSSLPETACFAAPLAMFAALFLYGLVEYNLADSEVVLLYALAMGLTGPSLLRAAPDAAADVPVLRRHPKAWLLAYLVLGAALCGGYALLCRSYLRILAGG
jgi:hypothetical protein